MDSMEERNEFVNKIWGDDIRPFSKMNCSKIQNWNFVINKFNYDSFTKIISTIV